MARFLKRLFATETIINASYDDTLNSIDLSGTLNESFIHTCFTNYALVIWEVLVHSIIHIFQMLTYFTIQFKKKHIRYYHH